MDENIVLSSPAIANMPSDSVTNEHINDLIRKLTELTRDAKQKKIAVQKKNCAVTVEDMASEMGAIAEVAFDLFDKARGIFYVQALAMSHLGDAYRLHDSLYSRKQALEFTLTAAVVTEESNPRFAGNCYSFASDDARFLWHDLQANPVDYEIPRNYAFQSIALAKDAIHCLGSGFAKGLTAYHAAHLAKELFDAQHAGIDEIYDFVIIAQNNLTNVQRRQDLEKLLESLE